MPLFQLLLGCLSSSQHSLKAFWDKNLIFLIYLCFLAWGGSSGWGCTWLVMPFVPYTHAMVLQHPHPEVPAPAPPFPAPPGLVKLSYKTCKPSSINLPIHSADISCAGAFSSICWFEVGFLFVLGAPLLSALAVLSAL